jgi:hypothetical protein
MLLLFRLLPPDASSCLTAFIRYAYHAADRICFFMLFQSAGLAPLAVELHCCILVCIHSNFNIKNGLNTFFKSRDTAAL